VNREKHSVKGVHGIRYQVKDVARSIAFYTRHLGFQVRHQQPPAFASVGCRQIQIEDPDGNPIELFEPAQ
jgi:hypothetical protein